MEDLIRVQTERDRQLLRWLEQTVGCDAIRAAVAALGGDQKPWVSQVCRQLNVRPRSRGIAGGGATVVGEQSLAAIRTILACTMKR